MKESKNTHKSVGSRDPQGTLEAIAYILVIFAGLIAAIYLGNLLGLQ